LFWAEFELWRDHDYIGILHQFIVPERERMCIKLFQWIVIFDISEGKQSASTGIAIFCI
jgi:hypothetical protein